ncbi:NADPH-dependent FMN reductase [Streptomyces lonarensis]|uniref:NAD(P)H-dependent oxidoreductase n=1 Tax=Streptomyces lonarensis TaxID=700599 RepID=A0A7X6HY15_9ACTN|nr:NAD(P)H-dependent oxidoreductase [Streptomyces lonarensis]NJQ04709.1 NAD(P)H-dependent oxidoreductase [Streptomyces lonarensis]
MLREDGARLAIVVDDVRRAGLNRLATEWISGRAHVRGDFQVDVLDLAEAWLPAFGPTDGPGTDEVRALAPWLAAADAFVLITPERNRSFPGALKNAIDWYDQEWQAKPIGFVSYGEATEGLCAVTQLRQVFAHLHMVTVRDAVSFRAHEAPFPPGGRPAVVERCERAAAAMLDQLSWWARALREARKKHPYGVRARTQARNGNACGRTPCHCTSDDTTRNLSE